jgi:hypothetical protein
MVIQLKASSNKQRSKILNQANIEGWNWENKSIKKKKTKNIAIKRSNTKFNIKIGWN